MGKGSTQVQHLVETEVPPRLLEQWLELWTRHYGIAGPLHVKLRPNTASPELLELSVLDPDNNKVADVTFATIHDRMGKNMISVRNQNTFDESYRQKRLMALIHVFLIHRYKCVAVHYVSPTEDNEMQTKGMKALGIYDEVKTEVGHIIAAKVNTERITELLNPDHKALGDFIAKKSKAKTKAGKKSSK
jgi:isocitrate lyase